ncbi:hypothetical protein MTO96_031137 [Rhipicephalus appendiculatus]
MPEAMVDGETITDEEASAPGWIDAIRRRAKSSTTTTGKPAGARIGALRTGAATRVAAASRLPRCQRIITVSSSAPEVAWITPNLQTAEAYAKVRAIVLMERAHPVSAYVVASGTTSRGVVRGVDADLPDSELQRLFVSSHNPTLMGVRRIKDTTTIILLFDGLKVPNYVRCGMLLLRLHALQATDRHLPQLRPRRASTRRLPYPIWRKSVNTAVSNPPDPTMSV